MKKLLLILCGLLALPLSGSVVGLFRELKDDIGIVARDCDSHEILVNEQGWKLTAADFCKKGYNPVRVYIENKSDKVVSISDASLQCASIEIKHMIEYLKPPALMWPVLSGVFFCTTGAVSYMAGMTNNMDAQKSDRFEGEGVVLYSLIGSCAGVFCTLIASPFCWWKHYVENKRLYAVVSQALHIGSVTISPGRYAEKIFLIPADHRGPIEILVFDEEQIGVLTKFYINYV